MLVDIFKTLSSIVLQIANFAHDNVVPLSSLETQVSRICRLESCEFHVYSALQ